jgi:hypothetical protein
MLSSRTDLLQHRSDRLWLLLVILLHLLGAATWLGLMPGGFPLSHPRFWTNRVLPAAVIVLCAVGVMAMRRRRDSIALAVVISLLIGWLAFAVTSRVVFPHSARWLSLVPVVAVAVLFVRVYRLLRQPECARVSLATLAILGAATCAAGVALPILERAPAAATRPLFDSSMQLPSVSPAPQFTAVLHLGEGVQVTASDGSLTLQNRKTVIWLQPLLTFDSRSPDGCWTIFAPRAFRRPTLRTLLASNAGDGKVELTYSDDANSTMHAQHRSKTAAGSCELESFSRLARKIYSHLNSFTAVEIAGHGQLSLCFSPCPERRIEIRPADYPVGRPGRSAYMDAQGVFHVVEASTGEKGPFRELARGPLSRGDPLSISVFDGQTPACTITLDDWPAQADTTLSPTAGWGLPTNAIEFHLAGEASSPAEIFVTLAATSVGRGWDTVGHSAGTYRNRMRVEFPDSH